MTFATDLVRLKFHTLPTATQVQYSDMDVRMAKDGFAIHIEGAMQDEKVVEVILRLTSIFNNMPL